MFAHRGIQCSVGLAVFGALVSGQTRAFETHRLEATPTTVAYGYYWSAATPALRIQSGDIIDVDTLLTNRPASSARASSRIRFKTRSSALSQKSPAIAGGPVAIS
jgi:hypothetical protein